ANRCPSQVIPGHEARSVEALCWAAGERLFGAGFSGEIMEYDLAGLRMARCVDGGGGPIWSMAANSSGTQLAVSMASTRAGVLSQSWSTGLTPVLSQIGCEDGSVKLFQVVPGGIQFERNLDRRKGRILCLSWHPSGTHIAAGSIDVFRVFDVCSGQTMKRIMVNYYVQKVKRECIVWSIAFLSSGTVVTSDSFGRVQFWDWERGTLQESHTVSTSAVLSLAVSEKEDSIVVGTSTGATYQFQLLPVKMGSLEKRWVRTKPFQHHTHDVRAVAHSSTALISGGLDAQLVIRPLMEKMQKKGYDAALRKFTFPHRRLVSCARKARLLLFQFSQHLELWRLGSTEETGKDGQVLPLCRMPEHLLQLKSKGPEHIYCSCVSPCGSWVAYSTASRFHLYRVQYESNSISVKK
ncbi:UTP4 protein, partial [Ceuthmochares aereus]|nr:UTP4 protein [Ceuthmochares aereus]